MKGHDEGLTERRLEAIERQAKALELRKAGATYAAIANAIGYDGPGSAYKAVHAGIKKILREPAEGVIELELARLDEMLRAVWPRILQGDVQAIDRGLRIMERRSRYLGLDAPTKIDIRHMIEELADEAGLNEQDTIAAVREAERIAKGRE